LVDVQAREGQAQIDQVNQVCHDLGMAEIVTVTEAKTQLSSLIERVTDGEEIERLFGMRD
jgi:hypothetical protein